MVEKETEKERGSRRDGIAKHKVLFYCLPLLSSGLGRRRRREQTRFGCFCRVYCSSRTLYFKKKEEEEEWKETVVIVSRVRVILRDEFVNYDVIHSIVYTLTYLFKCRCERKVVVF